MAEPDSAPLWIFAYGSLMWRPDFPFDESVRARLAGHHRSLCIHSHHYRGTPEAPGLVLGLDHGGSCLGVAFRVPDAARTATAEAVRAREMVTGVYREAWKPVVLADGRRVTALAYLADRRHAQYAGRLDPGATAAIVRDAQGVAGANADYVRNTHRHLLDLGIVDVPLAAVVAALDGIDLAEAPG